MNERWIENNHIVFPSVGSLTHNTQNFPTVTEYVEIPPVPMNSPTLDSLHFVIVDSNLSQCSCDRIAPH